MYLPTVKLSESLLKRKMQRTRIWVNFSKEYKEEYDKAIKESNFSGLVCRLLREYYNNNKDDKLDEIYKMLKNIKIDNIEIEDKDEDFIIW